MNTKLLYTMLTLLMAIQGHNGFSQGWTKIIGTIYYDEAYCIQQTFDGGYIITGNTYPNNPWDMDLYLIKINSNGDLIWTKTYGTTGNETGVDVKQTTDNGYIICGNNAQVGPGGYNVWILKTDSNGDTLWTSKFGGLYNDYGNSVFETDDGGYVIVGSTESFGAGGSDFWIIQTDENGDSLWSATYGGPYHEIAYEAQATSDGSFVIAGAKQTQGFYNSDVWLLKINSNGEIDWSQTYGGNYDELAYSVSETADAGFIVSGYTNSFGSGAQDLWLIKTDMYGDTMWTKTYGGPLNDCGNSVIETAEGDFVICGYTFSYSANSDLDLWMVKTDIGGYTLWTKAYGGSGSENGFAVIEAFDGGLTACGSTSTWGAGDTDVWLLHTDQDGTVGIPEQKTLHPAGYFLNQNYPNPFTTNTTIGYSLDREEQVKIDVFNIEGKRICNLVNEIKHAGSYQIPFYSGELKPGIYFYSIETSRGSQYRKMIIQN